MIEYLCFDQVRIIFEAFEVYILLLLFNIYKVR